jgi:hypothetical protein
MVVKSSGALAFAPRSVELALDGSTAVVRQLNGDLIWLETAEYCAFPDGDQIRTSRYDTDSVPVPRNTGSEARALSSLNACLSWADAQLASGNLPRKSRHLGRKTLTSTAVAGTGHEFFINCDIETGIALKATGQLLRGPFTVEVEKLELGDFPRGMLEPIHLRDSGLEAP